MEGTNFVWVQFFEDHKPEKGINFEGGQEKVNIGEIELIDKKNSKLYKNYEIVKNYGQEITAGMLLD